LVLGFPGREQGRAAKAVKHQRAKARERGERARERTSERERARERKGERERARERAREGKRARKRKIERDEDSALQQLEAAPLRTTGYIRIYSAAIGVSRRTLLPALRTATFARCSHDARSKFLTAVEQMQNRKDSRGQNLALAFR